MLRGLEILVIFRQLARDAPRFRGCSAATACALLLSCASPASYTRGRLPPSALAEPEVRLEQRRAPPAAPVQVDTIDALGTVTGIEAGAAPRRGFRLDFRTPAGDSLSLDVGTWRSALPAVEPKTPVHVQLDRKDGTRLLIADAAGPLFFLFTGPTAPDQRELPIRVVPAPDRVYLESRTASDLCRWTWNHQQADVSVEDLHQRVPPGGSIVVGAGGETWRVTLADARSPEDSDCGAAGEPRIAFFWTRIPPARGGEPLPRPTAEGSP
jgi:hypothetical protein